MNKLAVNLTTIFKEVPFLERFKKARENGFSYVECQLPYAHSIEEIQKELDQHELSMVIINLPAGNWEKGDRGIAANPDKVQEFRKSVEKGINYANGLNTSRIHCMAGITTGIDPKLSEEVYLENLLYAGRKMAENGITLLIEPINTFDMPGYFLNNIEQAKRILKAVDLPNVKLQFDFYHVEKIHGDSLSVYKQNADLLGHVQIADAPGRNQPGMGKMNYQEIFQYLNETYKGYIGAEYIPSGKSEESFEWLSLV